MRMGVVDRLGRERLDQLLMLCILSCILTFNLYLMYAAITLQPKIVNDTHCNAGELDPISGQEGEWHKKRDSLGRLYQVSHS